MLDADGVTTTVGVVFGRITVSLRMFDVLAKNAVVP